MPLMAKAFLVLMVYKHRMGWNPIWNRLLMPAFTRKVHKVLCPMLKLKMPLIAKAFLVMMVYKHRIGWNSLWSRFLNDIILVR